MAKIFALDAQTKQVIQDALDDLLANGEEGGLGKTCSLVYPPRFVACSNCIVDPLSGRSMGRYRSGGPSPFTGGKCPLCGGEGRKPEEVSEQITLGCNWDLRRFVTPLPIAKQNMFVPYSLVETKGFLKDLPKILKCDHLVLQLPIQGLIRNKFRLLVQPGDRSNIIQNRYFYAVWEQFNG
jgi:hypothetical protein